MTNYEIKQALVEIKKIYQKANAADMKQFVMDVNDKEDITYFECFNFADNSFIGNCKEEIIPALFRIYKDDKVKLNKLKNANYYQQCTVYAAAMGRALDTMFKSEENQQFFNML